MAKLLFFSDIHIHQHKNQISRLEDCLRALEWVFKTAKERNIKSILFGGDLFQDRHKIHIISYEKTFNLIRKLMADNPDINLYLLIGNHDMWYSERWDVSSVSPLRAINKVTVIDRPSTLTIEGTSVDFLPYTKNPLECINEYFKKKSDILLAHLAIDGAALNGLYQTRSEVSIEYDGDMIKVDTDALLGWKRVFLGHYHSQQQLNSQVEYIGSPLELNFGEAHQQKHIIIHDTDSNENEYIINDFSPKHLIIRDKDIGKYKLNGNFVQIMVDDIASTNMVDIREQLSKNVGSLEFKEQKKQEDVTSKEVKFDFSSGEIFEKYIKVIEHNLDHKQLLKTVKHIVMESET